MVGNCEKGVIVAPLVVDANLEYVEEAADGDGKVQFFADLEAAEVDLVLFGFHPTVFFSAINIRAINEKGIMDFKNIIQG